MEILSETSMSNIVAGNSSERIVQHDDVNTLATIRDIEKGLEANLQEYEFPSGFDGG